jgi:ribulose-5-phosphate 4-epimerase/fuculose-1-phosphate aldolase
MDPKERALRVQLAAAYRLIDHWGMSELIYNHISVRLPGPDDHFLINPFGLMYREIRASNLVKIDLEGNIIASAGGFETRPYRVNRAGFVIHSAIHRARPDAQCIVHTHTPAGMAVVSLKEGLIPVALEGLRFHNQIAFHEFRGITLSMEEQESLVKSFGDKRVLLLRNHGLLTVGPTVAQAVCLMYYLERACQVQLMAQSTGRELNSLSQQLCEYTASQHWNKVEQLDDLVWPALIRMLDQKDPTYKK